MERTEIIQKIQKLQREDVIFVENGEKVSPRFNAFEGESRISEDDLENELAKSLYSVVSFLALHKARWDDTRDKALDCLSSFLNRIINTAPIEHQDNLKAEKEKAMIVYKDFLYTPKNENIMASIFAKTFPFLIVKASLVDDKIDSKAFHVLSKNKEVIFNKVSLFVRSLFMAFYNLQGVDAKKVVPDYENPDSSYMKYEGNLIMASYKDSFTLESLKKEMLSGIDNISSNFSLKECRTISVLSLLRAFIASVEVSK